MIPFESSISNSRLHINVITWNLMLSVKPPLRYNGAQERASLAASAFYSSPAVKQINVDFICLQELSVHRNIVLSSFVHHPFCTKEMRSSIFGRKPRLWPSGLAVLSAHPIEKERHFIFEGPTYHIEKIVAKGMLYVASVLPDRTRVHLMNIHLNAWSTPEAKKARNSQIAQIKKWITELQIPPEEPAFLIGDFNIDWYENSSEINQIAQTLGARPVRTTSGLMFTFDGQSNPLVGLDAPEEYRLAKTGKGCYEDILNEEGCPCCPRQLLDGAMRVSPKEDSGSQFLEKKAQIFRPQSMSPFEINFNFFTKRFIRDVSDHFAILYTFSFLSTASGTATSWAAKTGRSSPISFERNVSKGTSNRCAVSVVGEEEEEDEKEGNPDNEKPRCVWLQSTCPHTTRSCTLDSKFEWGIFLTYFPFILLFLLLVSVLVRYLSRKALRWRDAKKKEDTAI
jgi:endonuclease/exonuclease/phosphatase family metal-dependent hydrolase